MKAFSVFQIKTDSSPTPRIIQGDCLDVMRSLIDEGVQVHSIVCDPPYGIAFMGKGWDSPDNVAFRTETWKLAFDLLAPGGHLLAFSATRTYHRMAVAIEDAGFEIRDMISWMYGSGFPKSHDVSKGIDKKLGAERPIVGTNPNGRPAKSKGAHCGIDGEYGYGAEPTITAPATDEARQWDGWGTALKPAHEPIVVARKPLIGTVAENVLAHSTGGLNIDGCRIDANAKDVAAARVPQPQLNSPTGHIYGFQTDEGRNGEVFDMSRGRWPANAIHDGSEEVEEAFAAFGYSKSSKSKGGGDFTTFSSDLRLKKRGPKFHSDSGTASRFFYSAKASKKERRGSKHPTVKPISLIRYLQRLVTPPGGITLDIFGGSGTAAEAAMLEEFQAIVIEREAEYIEVIHRRVREVQEELAICSEDSQAAQPELFDDVIEE